MSLHDTPEQALQSYLLTYIKRSAIDGVNHGWLVNAAPSQGFTADAAREQLRRLAAQDMAVYINTEEGVLLADGVALRALEMAE